MTNSVQRGWSEVSDQILEIAHRTERTSDLTRMGEALTTANKRIEQLETALAKCRDAMPEQTDKAIDALMIESIASPDAVPAYVKAVAVQLERENADLRKDAARYKKLVAMEEDLVEPVTIWHYLRNPDDLDAAMKEQT